MNILIITKMKQWRTDSEHEIFPQPSVKITKGSIGHDEWPACDLFLSIWWCVHCFRAAAFHRCLPAALFTVAAIILLALYDIFFTPSHWSENSCWCVPGLMQWRVQCVCVPMCYQMLLVFQCSELLWHGSLNMNTSMQEWWNSFIMSDCNKYLCPRLCVKPLRWPPSNNTHGRINLHHRARYKWILCPS